ncbi:unnamed protein product [Aphanomyces euteiches]|uniref:Uncharacterized protein n=1 Tax=Aphanomyces euteiches TaxID=100861 RepID=A0A6G0XMB1_9STRA|nr:hypothetical protein Ae201684_003469 [Aphanomyces euteiches]KAH9155323.1 hypothetical protein AeRB84_002689 [Aphanomyces euteiches]
MSELAAILARRRAKDGTGEEPPKETPAPAVSLPSTRPSPPKVFAPKPFANAPAPLDTASSTATATSTATSENAEATAAPVEEQPTPRKTSSKIAALQGNLGALNVNAFRPPPTRKAHTVSAMTTGEDYDYESTMKTGSSMPGMVGIPMIGLAKPGFALPGMAKKESTPDDESQASSEPEPAAVSHATMARATGPKRRAPTKPKVATTAEVDKPTEPVGSEVSTDSTEPIVPSVPTESSIPSAPSVVSSAAPSVVPTAAPSEEPRRPSMGLFGALPSQPPAASAGTIASNTEKRPSGVEHTAEKRDSATLFGAASSDRPRPPSGGVSLFGMAPPPVVEKRTSGTQSLFGSDSGVNSSSSTVTSSSTEAASLSTKSLFEPETPPKPQPPLVSGPAKLQQLYAQDDDDESSDEWDDDKPNALFKSSPAPTATKQQVGGSLFGATPTPALNPAPVLKATQPPPPAKTAQPIGKATSLFGGDDSDSDSDDAEGLFGTGLPRK